jgi:hypothetical protein
VLIAIQILSTRDHLPVAICQHFNLTGEGNTPSLFTGRNNEHEKM